MSWTNFKEKHLFSVNVAILLGVILYQVRKDFTFHAWLITWPFLTAMFPSLKTGQLKFFKLLGFINSTILLMSFYFLFLTPFSVFYRHLFQSDSFKKKTSSFVNKTSISDFDRPF